MLKTCLRGTEYVIQFLFILQSLVVKLSGEGGGQRNVQKTNFTLFFEPDSFFPTCQYSESLVDLERASLIVTRGHTYRHYTRFEVSHKTIRIPQVIATWSQSVAKLFCFSGVFKLYSIHRTCAISLRSHTKFRFLTVVVWVFPWKQSMTHLVTEAITQLFLQPQFSSHRTRLLNY